MDMQRERTPGNWNPFPFILFFFDKMLDFCRKYGYNFSDTWYLYDKIKK